MKNARRAGFTLIELMVSISIIAILAGLLLDRATFYQEQAEKVAMEQTVGILRSALHMQAAKLFVKGGAENISMLIGQNPMTWLAERPPNYVGEYYAPKAEDVVSGSWYFDLHDRNLIYLVHNNAHFVSVSGVPNQLRFRVKLIRELASNHKSGEKREADIEGVILEEVLPYTWF